MLKPKLLDRENRLAIPLRAKKPRVYAVWNDLFHECVTNAQIAAVFGVMATAKQLERRHAETETA